VFWFGRCRSRERGTLRFATVDVGSTKVVMINNNVNSSATHVITSIDPCIAEQFFQVPCSSYRLVYLLFGYYETLTKEIIQRFVNDIGSDNKVKEGN
jgi:hypothetical protein